MENAFNTLEEKLNADVFVYYGELIDGVEADVKQIIEQICKEDQKHEILYVILTTPGGSLNPVKRMVNISAISIQRSISLFQITHIAQVQ